MKKYFIYLLVYSFGGYVLERIINLIAFGKWVENRVLIGPYQPLYGAGIVLAILVYDLLIVKYISNKNIKGILDFYLFFDVLCNLENLHLHP